VKKILIIVVLLSGSFSCAKVEKTTPGEVSTVKTATEKVDKKYARPLAYENINKLRQALDLYYQQNNAYPENLVKLVPDYIEVIPDDGVLGKKSVELEFTGMGGWFYNPSDGSVFINLPGDDDAGKAWKSY
jgi:hypothetical protein